MSKSQSPSLKTIVITGVTRGLGQALALHFAQLGNTVVGCGRSIAGIEAMRRKCGPPSDFVMLDVTDGAGVGRWANRVLKTIGIPDLLINNAAAINRNANFWETPEAEFSQVIDVNLKGVGNVLRAFLPAMVAKNQGVIINMSSGAGRMGIGSIATYCATKWGIEGLTQSLADELPDGMAAIPLSPGMVNTEMLRTNFGEEAYNHPTPEVWVEKAAPFILQLGPEDNGMPLSTPA